MSHFAYVDNGIVTRVIVAEQDFIDSLPDAAGWIQTSYNTRGGVHYDKDGNPDGGIPLRKNYAGIGYVYDPIRDAFMEPQPFPSWKLDEETCLWQPPVPAPTTGGPWMWDEDSLTWTEA